MTTFRATPEDLTGVIREHQRGALRRYLPYPAAALLTGLLLLQVERTLAAFAVGMAAAWAWSTIQELRAVRPTVLWTYAWLQEDITVTTDEEGLRISSARGASFLRWDGGIRVQSRADFFLIKDEGDELAILPKKYLTEAELLALNSHAGRQG